MFYWKRLHVLRFHTHEEWKSLQNVGPLIGGRREHGGDVQTVISGLDQFSHTSVSSRERGKPEKLLFILLVNENCAIPSHPNHSLGCRQHLPHLRSLPSSRSHRPRPLSATGKEEVLSLIQALNIQQTVIPVLPTRCSERF